MYVCVDCVLLKVVIIYVNVDIYVDFVVVYVWNFFEGGIKIILIMNVMYVYCIFLFSLLLFVRFIMIDKKL